MTDMANVDWNLKSKFATNNILFQVKIKYLPEWIRREGGTDGSFTRDHQWTQENERTKVKYFRFWDNLDRTRIVIYRIVL